MNKSVKVKYFLLISLPLLDLLSNKMIFDSKLFNALIQQRSIISLFDDIYISLNQIHY